jgi:hypothetical protein
MPAGLCESSQKGGMMRPEPLPNPLPDVERCTRHVFALKVRDSSTISVILAEGPGGGWWGVSTAAHESVNLYPPRCL